MAETAAAIFQVLSRNIFTVNSFRLPEEKLQGVEKADKVAVVFVAPASDHGIADILLREGPAVVLPVVQQVVEGIYSAKAALALARKYQIQMPIVEQVNEVLFHDKKALDAFNELMNRERKDEV